MRVLITSGGTREYIDDVRILTNVSSGRLGAVVADEFIRTYDHEVFYIHSSGAVLPKLSTLCNCVEASSVRQVEETMNLIVPKVDMVIHAMAVSDFYFERENPTKVPGNSVEALAEYIKVNGRVSPKIISSVKKWNPDVILVGFKFTVGKTEEELVNIAKQSCHRNGCNLVVANDKKLMEKANTHLAFFVKPDGQYQSFYGKPDIAKGLLNFAGGFED